MLGVLQIIAVLSKSTSKKARYGIMTCGVRLLQVRVNGVPWVSLSFW